MLAPVALLFLTIDAVPNPARRVEPTKESGELTIVDAAAAPSDDDWAILDAHER